MSNHPSDVRDHVFSLAFVVCPPQSNVPWYESLIQKYHIELAPGQDIYQLTVEQIYALWSGLLGTESDRFAADTTLSDVLKAKGERY